MKKIRVFIGIIWAIALSVGLVSLWLKQASTPKFAYVRSVVVMEQFKGIQEAGHAYQQKLTSMQVNVDTLRVGIERDIQQLQQEANLLSTDEVNARSKQIRTQKMALARYEQALSQKAQEEEQLLQGALNQLNSLLEQFAQEKGYDLLLGTTQDGSLLYGNTAFDVTEEVIQYLNQHY